MQRKVLVSFALGALALLPVGFARGADAPAKPAAAPAADGAPGKPDSQGGKKKERKIKIEAPEGTIDYDDATQTYTITLATVELPDSNAILRADRIEYNKGEKWMRATGKPRMWDERNELTADVIRADINVKCANADGNVRLVARPKDAKTESGKKARSQVKEPVVVQCDAMQYFYKDKKGTGTGNLRITQKDEKWDRTATGRRLAYDGNDEVVTLEGDVEVNNTRGEGFKCKQVAFSIKDGAEGFRVSGLTGGVFFVQDDDGDEGGKKGPQAGSGGGPAKPPAPAGEGGSAPASDGKRE